MLLPQTRPNCLKPHNDEDRPSIAAIPGGPGRPAIQLACDERRYQARFCADDDEASKQFKTAQSATTPWGLRVSLIVSLFLVRMLLVRRAKKRASTAGKMDYALPPISGTPSSSSPPLAPTLSPSPLPSLYADVVRLVTALPVYRIHRRYSLGTNTLHPVLARQRKNARRHAQARAQRKWEENETGLRDDNQPTVLIIVTLVTHTSALPYDERLPSGRSSTSAFSDTSRLSMR
ncbi:hypothetical protein C8F01DRAFT_1368635 [Mycena amicta]|nr:hypothetical protein C8F01DRAFT_1368635 [Mycena amicta]